MISAKKMLMTSGLLSLSLLAGAAGAAGIKEVDPKAEFEARPWSFWYWMYGDVTEEGIKADLQAMKDVGLGGTYLMPIKSVETAPQYNGKAPQLSPEWWRLVGRSLQIADSLGLKIGMHICDGFALAGGPWITPAESMQMVVSADTVVKGGKISALKLPQPPMKENYYEDIRVLAMPVKGKKINLKPTVTVANLESNVPEGKGVSRDEKGVVRSSVPCEIVYEYPEPVTARSVEIILTGNNYQAHRINIQASDNGRDWREVKQLVPARHGWQNTDFNSTSSIPTTTAKYFRFTWTPVGSEPGSEDLDAAKWKPNLKIKDIVLSGEPKVNQWEGKAGLVWRVADATPSSEVTEELCVTPDEIIDLTSQVNDGILSATLPKGEWRLMRFGHTSTGHTNATGGAGRGLEADKFSRESMTKQFNNWFGKVFEKTDPEIARRALKYMHVDSWECGSQNWSDNFAKEFKDRRGYDLMPYLPLFAGVPMTDAATSEKVLRDVRQTQTELVVDVFYDVLAEKAEEYGVEFSAECVSPTMVSDGMLHYQKVDLPMGEFWLDSPTHDKPNDMLDAIHGAHVYGKPIVQAEGFTELRGTWDETPAYLKTLLDRNYALGINRIFYHVNAHNPYLDKKPGMTLDGVGLFFQRDNTWYRDGGKALTDYMRNVQAQLQRGVPVNDIAVFTGEEIPRRAVLPDRLVPSLPGIFGPERVASEKKRLANEWQPTRVRPVGVTHSANMADPEKWVNSLRGYGYDSVNKDALLRLAKVENGRIVLPGGASYGVFVLPAPNPLMPDTTLSPEMRAKVEEFRKAGVIIPEVPYMNPDFSAYGLERDVIVPEDVAWTHRRVPETGEEIYFVANQQESPREISASFRVNGLKPVLYNPQTGLYDENPKWHSENGRTVVDLSLAPAESAFVLFREPTAETASLPREITTGVVPFDMLQTKDWTVTFPNVEEPVVTRELFRWEKSDNDKIRYFSGTASYVTEFKAPRIKKGERVYISLEGLSDVATVRVNGKDCGIAWTAPYRVDITDAVKKGKNTLELDVTNTWANALNGADNGNAPFEGIWTNGKYRRADKSLVPSGLTGPVSIITVSEKESK